MSRRISGRSAIEQLESRLLMAAHARTLPLQWVDQFGSASHDAAHGVAVDKQGNSYTVGEFSGTVDFDPGPSTFNLTSAGGTDVFIVKLDRNGRFIWAKAVGGPEDDVANDVAIDQNGNVYVTGFYQGTADFDPSSNTFNLTSNGGSDAFALKLTSTGNFVWADSFGGPNFDRGADLAVDRSGNVYVIGDYVTEGDFDPGPNTLTLTSNGFRDVFVVKLNANGSLNWAKSFGGPDASEEGWGIALDNQGNVYIDGGVGAGAMFDNITIGNNGSHDAFVAKLTNSGSVVWAENMGGPGFDQAFAIAMDQQGNVYSTGAFRETADFDPGSGTANLTSNGLGDIFVSKLDTNGKFVWARSAGSSNDDIGLGIAVSTNRNVYVTGTFTGTADFNPGPAVFNLTSNGLSDIFLWKLDRNGNFNTALSIGGTGNETADDVALNHGGIYLAGSFQGTVNFNPNSGIFNLVSNGDFDGFTLKLRDPQANSLFF